MVVDTSVLTAILIGEPERELFEDLILAEPTVVTSAIVPVEVSIVLRNKRLHHEEALLDEMLAELDIRIRPFDAEQAVVARRAHDRFGKGRHPARLNFGDCLVYALAASRQDRLLFKGGDFALTDITPAWAPAA